MAHSCLFEQARETSVKMKCWNDDLDSPAGQELIGRIREAIQNSAMPSIKLPVVAWGTKNILKTFS